MSEEFKVEIVNPEKSFPSKAGTTTSETSSFVKKDFSGLTISTLNSSLIRQHL